MRYSLGLFVLLSAFWLVNSPNDSTLLLFLGVLSVALVMLLAHRMKLVDRESLPLHLFSRIGPFYCWLIKEIILGSIYVLKKIILRDQSFTPGMITIKLDFKDKMSEVIFVNSITLVPGTLSVQHGQGSIQVHTLTQELADSLNDGQLAEKIKRLEN
jgi:multicomponent Na+:H+ antiporter subunit E